MTENQTDAVLREKLLYRYTSAVERGDFATTAAILTQAEVDPLLEQMIVEINAALVAGLPPSARATARPRLSIKDWLQAGRRALTPSLGLGAAILLLLFCVFGVVGPAMRNTMIGISGRPTLDDGKNNRGFYYDVYDATPAPDRASPGDFNAYPAPTESTAAFYYPTMPGDASLGYPAPEDFAAWEPTHTPYSARPSGAAATVPAAQERMVAHNGYLVMTVADTRETRDMVSGMITEYAGEGAYILSSSEQGVQGSDQPGIFMRLRVPVAGYDALMDRLVGLALTVDARREQADDVTAEFVDTQARIRELETAIARLLEIASQAQNTADLLQVEQALSDRRAELEALKGRAQYLSHTAALSLIQLELRPNVVAPTPTPFYTPTPPVWRPGDTVQRSTLTLLDDLRRFVDWLIAFGITTLPWLLALGLAGFAGYRMWRKRRPSRG